MMQADFRFFDLRLGSRLLIAGFCFATAVLIQISFSVVWGLVFAVLGWVPLVLRRASNKPDDCGLEEWRLVTVAEIDRLDDGLRQAKALRRKTRTLGGVKTLMFGIILLVLLRAVTAFTDREDFWLIGLDLAFFLTPAVFFGRIAVFVPPTIAMKMPCFRVFLSRKLPETMGVAPYIRYDKDPSDADIPEDLRLMLELKRSPADLVGIQIQAAINRGPAGEVPYAYAVVLTKGTAGPSYATAQAIQQSGYLVEAGGDGDYGTVVIRRDGYSTGLADCEHLHKICVDLLTAVARQATLR
jgi:hypothetical protein